MLRTDPMESDLTHKTVASDNGDDDFEDYPSWAHPVRTYDQLTQEEKDELSREVQEAIAKGKMFYWPNFNPWEFEKRLTYSAPVPSAPESID